MMDTIGFLGCGNMGGAIARAVCKAVDPKKVFLANRTAAKAQALAKEAIDDGLLDIPFKVVGFETVFFDNMGNAIPLASAGASFSARQREEFRKLYRNRRFYISHIRAVGPDGIMRTLPSAMEVIVK